MKFLYRAFLVLILLSAKSLGVSYAGAGIIDLKIANGNLNATNTVYTFDILMKTGTGYSPRWDVTNILMDIDYGTYNTASLPPTATIAQNLNAALATSATEDPDAFVASRALNAERTIQMSFQNPIQAGNTFPALTGTYQLYSSVTVTFSSAIGADATFTLRSTVNPATINIIQFRSNWTDENANLLEFNPANPAATPLPVKLLTFAATKAGTSRSLISWVTATEEAVSYFEVERSLTGNENSYRSIGVKVPATGTSKTEVSYQAYDEKAATGANYYRLKMVDINGGVTYSSTRIVHFDNRGATESVSLFPNPIRMEGTEVKLKVDVLSAQTLDYTLTDVTGKLIYAGKMDVATGSNNYKVAGFESIAPGSYFLRIKGTTLSDNIKVLKMD
jgi:hypothetical protein